MRAEVRRRAEIPRRRLGRSELEVSALALGSWQTFERRERVENPALERTQVSVVAVAENAGAL